jgi:hypothetical protein
MLDMDFQLNALEEALETLGAVLQERRTPFELLAIGGSGLLLLGLIDRPTGDVDIIALLQSGAFHKLESLPEPLESAAMQVGEALGLGDRWLNTGPSMLMDFGLPNDWESRLVMRQYGGLCLYLPSREDQICFKLYAAVDQFGGQVWGTEDKHYMDLKALGPTRDELIFAAKWTVTHDPSEGFGGELVRCLVSLGVEVSDVELG